MHPTKKLKKRAPWKKKRQENPFEIVLIYRLWFGSTFNFERKNRWHRRGSRTSHSLPRSVSFLTFNFCLCFEPVFLLSSFVREVDFVKWFFCNIMLVIGNVHFSAFFFFPPVHVVTGTLKHVKSSVAWSGGTVHSVFFFPKLCLILKNRFLAWLSSNFQERLLMKYFMPNLFLGCLFLV